MKPRSFDFTLTVALALGHVVSLTTSFGQQIADSTFHPIVARPAFAQHPTRVLFDEAHHNFHTVAGRYRPFADLLQQDGCQLTPSREKFSDELLARFDILVIANAAGDDLKSGTNESVARTAFTPGEIDAVHRWVQTGGALLLIADHAPFGQAAADLAERFGIDMAKGYAVDKAQALGGDGDPGTIEFTRANGTLGSHAILRGRDNSEQISRIVAFTGQSLKGPLDSNALLLLSAAALDLPPSAPSYSKNPDALMRLARPAGGRSLGIALEVGRGRVMVLGEAAMLSAQLIQSPDNEPRRVGMNMDGIDNQQFALNVVRWLGGVLVDEPIAAINHTNEAPASVSPVSATSRTATQAPASSIAGSRPDFSGTWKLVAQETKAWRGRGSIGNHEEPVSITQIEASISIKVQSPDPNGLFVYDLNSAGPKRPDPMTEKPWSTSHWEHGTLVTTGRRAFTTPQGSQLFAFTEKRKLSPDGVRMIVEMRIEMQPTDLVRNSQYERVR